MESGLDELLDLFVQVLVAVQIAASCVLLIVAGLLVRAAQHVLTTDPGFGYEQVISIAPGLGNHGDTPAVAGAFLDQFVSRLRAQTPTCFTITKRDQ